MRRFAAAPVLALAVALAAATAGCSDGPSTLTVRDAWARPTAPGITDAAVYLTVTNPTGTPDRLVGGQTSACMALMVHQTVGTNGIDTMVPADGTAAQVPAHGTLVLAPLGVHLMCAGLAQRLVSGASLAVLLQFERAGARTVVVHVEDR